MVSSSFLRCVVFLPVVGVLSGASGTVFAQAAPDAGVAQPPAAPAPAQPPPGQAPAGEAPATQPSAGQPPAGSPAPPAGADPNAGFPPPYAPPPGFTPPPGYGPQGYDPSGYPPSAYPPAGYPPGYGYPPGGYAPPQHAHDGFYLRFHLGGGYMRFSNPVEKVSGGAVSGGIALGGIVLPNFAVYGTFIGIRVNDPELRDGKGTLTLTGMDATMNVFGAGATYYLMPLNLYLSGTLGLAYLGVTGPEGSPVGNRITRGGFAFQGMVGKEWWVSEDWGLGLAAEITAARVKDDPDFSDDSWSGFSFALLFSATYN